MSIHRFTVKQIEELRQNPNVKKVSDKAITYQDSFKEHFIIEHNKGKLPRLIFEEAGFDTTVLDKRYNKAADRWKQQVNRLEGFKDTRKGGAGRPRTKHLSQDEIIKRQKTEIEYLKQERDFLLELKRLERQAIRKQKLSQKTNSNLSKK